MIRFYVAETLAFGCLLAAVLMVVVHCTGCTEPETPRETARAVVLVAAEGVSAADAACAAVALGQRDRELAMRCADLYDVARESLYLADDALFAWERADEGKVACAVRRALQTMLGIADLVRARGGKVPPHVEDAARFGQAFAGACHE